MNRYGFISVISMIPANTMNDVRADFMYDLLPIREE